MLTLWQGEHASLFLADEIPRLIHIIFFQRIRKKGEDGQGHHGYLRKYMPPSLIAFVCTLIHHALVEWQNRGGALLSTGTAVAVAAADGSASSKDGQYHFNRANDAGKPFSFKRGGGGLTVS